MKRVIVRLKYGKFADRNRRGDGVYGTVKGWYGAYSWHVTFALHKGLNLGFVIPPGNPFYRRLYFGPVEIEWSGFTNESMVTK